jgi:hypothetical protein
MSLTEETTLDQITVTDTGAILVRRAAWILRDGVRLGAPTYHRTSYDPGAALGAEASIVQKIAALVWTPDVIAAAVARREAAAALTPTTEGVRP